LLIHRDKANIPANKEKVTRLHLDYDRKEGRKDGAESACLASLKDIKSLAYESIPKLQYLHEKLEETPILALSMRWWRIIIISFAPK